MEDLAAAFKLEHHKLSLNILNLAGNQKCKPFVIATLLCSLANNSSVPIDRLVLNNNDMEVSKKTNSPAYFQLTKAIIAMLSCSKYLTHLSLANCRIGKEVMLAVGEGLFKNCRLQVLNMRGNRVKMNGIKEFVRSCFQNNKLALRNVDFSQN